MGCSVLARDSTQGWTHFLFCLSTNQKAACMLYSDPVFGVHSVSTMCLCGIRQAACMAGIGAGLSICTCCMPHHHLQLQDHNVCVMQAVLAAVNLLSQQSQQDHEPVYVTQHTSSDRHCGSCCIWNHLLTGGLVSVHLPEQRAIALLIKALLGLHAQAVAAGNPADTQVNIPACLIVNPCAVYLLDAAESTADATWSNLI